MLIKNKKTLIWITLILFCSVGIISSIFLKNTDAKKDYATKNYKDYKLA